MSDQTNSVSVQDTPFSSRKRFLKFSIKGLLTFTTLVVLVFSFFLPITTIRLDVLAIQPPYPQSRVDILQFEANSMASQVVVQNVLVSQSFRPRSNPTNDEKAKPYVVVLRLTGLQRIQYYRLLNPQAEVYLQPTSD